MTGRNGFCHKSHSGDEIVHLIYAIKAKKWNRAFVFGVPKRVTGSWILLDWSLESGVLPFTHSPTHSPDARGETMWPNVARKIIKCHAAYCLLPALFCSCVCAPLLYLNAFHFYVTEEKRKKGETSREEWRAEDETWANSLWSTRETESSQVEFEPEWRSCSSGSTSLILGMCNAKSQLSALVRPGKRWGNWSG